MADVELMTVREAAQALQRSDRSIRRYLQQDKLEYERVATGAGFKYLISAVSVDRLREQLQGRQAQGSNVGATDLAAQVAALQVMVERQTQEIARLREVVAGLLPPAPEEQAPQEQPRPWWRFWQRHKGED